MDKWILTALALALLVAVASSAAVVRDDSVVDYSGYRVLTFHLRDQNEVKALERLQGKYELDFWTPPRTDGAATDVMVGPEFYEALTGFLDELGVPYAIKFDNVQRLIDADAVRNRRGSLRFDGSFDHTAYHTFDEVMAILDNLEKSHPDLVSSYVAAQTHEGRPSRVVKVSTGGGGSKPAIWIDCGIHAREWVSTATCQYFLDQLTTGYGSHQGVTDLLDAHDFHILTVANPDGYVFSWDHNRIWRKNRHPYPGNLITCYGADPNRNFDSDFGGPGTSNAACTPIYHGEYAFSEPESQAIRDSVTNLKDVKAFFTLHAFSQFWMVPYGYTHDLPPNFEDQMHVAEAGAKALTAVHGTQYTVGNIADVVYLAAGGSTDWAYDKAGIQQAHALELRDTGTYGFFLPPEYILPNAEEVWAGIMAAINAI